MGRRRVPAGGARSARAAALLLLALAPAARAQEEEEEAQTVPQLFPLDAGARRLAEGEGAERCELGSVDGIIRDVAAPCNPDFAADT